MAACSLDSSCLWQLHSVTGPAADFVFRVPHSWLHLPNTTWSLVLMICCSSAVLQAQCTQHRNTSRRSAAQRYFCGQPSCDACRLCGSVAACCCAAVFCWCCAVSGSDRGAAGRLGAGGLLLSMRPAYHSATQDWTVAASRCGHSRPLMVAGCHSAHAVAEHGCSFSSM